MSLSLNVELNFLSTLLVLCRKEISHLYHTVVTHNNIYFNPFKSSLPAGSQVWQFSIVLSLAVLVTPGLHYDNRTRTNETAILLSRPCTLMEFVHTAQCFQTQFRLLCKGGITGEWIKGFQ